MPPGFETKARGIGPPLLLDSTNVSGILIFHILQQVLDPLGGFIARQSVTDRHREIRHGFLALSILQTCKAVHPTIDPIAKTRVGIIHASWCEASDTPAEQQRTVPAGIDPK